MAYVWVAALSELPDGSALGVETGGKRICLANCDGAVYAISDNCTHRDFPLSSGELDPEDGSITCEWHGAMFDVRSGRALCLPAVKPITVFACQVTEEGIFVDVEQTE